MDKVTKVIIYYSILRRNLIFFNFYLGYILPTLITMRHRIMSLDGGNVLKDFQESMINVLRRRFTNYFNITETNRDLVVAAISTPRFKLSFIEQDSQCKMASCMLLSECLKLVSESLDTTEVEIETTVDDSTDDDFFLSFGAMRALRRNSLEQNVEAEVNRFLEDDRKDLLILNEYPNVKKVYKKFNTTIPSSAAVERLFSQSSLIFTPRHNRILSEKIEKVSLLKHNGNTEL